MNRSQFRQLCNQLDPAIKKQVITIFKIEESMRKKVEEQIVIFEDQPAAQSVLSTQGERVLKANPAIQEIRALFRDYVTIVKAQHDILKTEQLQIEEPKNMLEQILKKRRKEFLNRNRNEENNNAINL